MTAKPLWLISAFVLATTLGCNRNIGPLPEQEPEYKALYFSGTVTAETLPHAKGVLFVAAAPAAGGPPPLAARYDVKFWPVQFELSDINLMGQGVEINGPHHLFARFDTDGDVGTRTSFDLEIRDSRDFDPGSTGISLVLAPLADAPAAEPSQLSIQGTVRAADGVAASTAGKTLFIFARGPVMPMPIAALRVADPVLPLSFALDDSHILMRDMPLPETLQIVARLDSDGDPVTKGPQDLEYTGEVGPRSRSTPVDVVLTPRSEAGAPSPQTGTSPAAAKPYKSY